MWWLRDDGVGNKPNGRARNRKGRGHRSEYSMVTGGDPERKAEGFGFFNSLSSHMISLVAPRFPPPYIGNF